MASLSSMLSYLLFLVLFLALPQESHGQLVPTGLLDFIPDICMPLLTDSVLGCAISQGCLSLLPSEEEIAAIPSEDSIQACVDVETALCPITSRCPACQDVANEFFKCIVINNEGGLSEATTALVTGCSLDCTLIVTDAPVVSPTEAPVAPVEEPSSVPVAEPSSVPVADSDEETEIIDDGSESAESGAMNMMVSSLAAIAAVTSFVLGW